MATSIRLFRGAFGHVSVLNVASDFVTGFWAFKTLAAADELDLLTRLSGTAGTTCDELAQALNMHPRPAEMLLTGCAALGLLEKDSGRYRNSPLAEEFLVRGNGRPPLGGPG